MCFVVDDDCSTASPSRTARKDSVTTSCVLRPSLNVRYGWKQLHKPGTSIRAYPWLAVWLSGNALTSINVVG